MIRDFFDRNADTRACDRTWLDVTFVALPATATAVLSLSDQLTRWMSSTPAMMPIVHVVLPVLALSGVVAIITMKTTRDALAGFAEQSSKKCPIEYRYCSAARQTAKVAFLPMLAIVITSLWAAMPNRFLGSTTAPGFVCTAKGSALSGSFVQLVDRTGTPVSEMVQADDRGFFFAELSPWKTRPANIRITTANCSQPEYSMSAALHGQSCPGEAVESPQTAESPIWITQCP
jgi:hypothetical protein